MAETLATAAGKRVELDGTDQEFAAAMAQPRADEPEAPSPPPIAPPDPDAPYGRTLGGRPKAGPGGRPAKPREIAAPPGGGGSSAGTSGRRRGRGDPPPPPEDYTARVAEFLDALWLLGAGFPVPEGETRTRVRAQAAVIKATAPDTARGVNIMAQHSAPVRRGVEMLTGGAGGWIIPACMALSPVLAQSLSVWRAPAAGAMSDLAARTEADFADVVAHVTGTKPAGSDENSPDTA